MAEPQDTGATAAASPSSTARASATHGKGTRKKKLFRFGASLSVFNYEEVWEDYKKKLVDEFAGNIDRLGNKNASKCMAVATANGTIEVNLIKALLPNLKSLSVFMPDDEKHAADVKATIEREFPGVDVTVIDATVQEFVAESESGEFKNAFDVAFVAHILFYLEKEERQELYNVLLDDILRPGGLMIVELNNCPRMKMLADVMSGNYHKTSMFVKEILTSGFLLVDKFKYSIPINFKNVSDAFLQNCSHIAKKPVTKEDLNAATEKVFPANKPEEWFTQQSTILFYKPLTVAATGR